MTAQQEILRRLYRDRPLAHKVLFAHRHPVASPPFHAEMQNDWHGPSRGVLDLVFRGGAKSTIAEEAIPIMAGFREFKNCLIIGENAERAVARLHAVKREFEANDLLRQAFGDLRGATWGEDRLVLSTGAAIQALGKGQSLRGIKHEDMRPDLVFGDDLENRQDVSTPEHRKKHLDWFTLDLLPACDPDYRVRVAATPLHPESLAMVLAKTPGWIVHTYPIYYLDENGEKQSSWPERFPSKDVLHLEQTYLARGQVQGFKQEYMCQSEAPETKAFKQEMFRIEPQVRSWQAVYSMTDPARTTNKDSADTGHVVWSWIGPKLVIWDAAGAQLMPSEIVDLQFRIWDEHHPVQMGIEEDGLNQFLLQPLRQEQVKRGLTIPIQPLKAPVGKFDFIRGLQPFFQAREVQFAKPLPDLQAQLLGFPTGKIDVPNALAYALKMRPGAPIYDDFNGRHIGEDLRPLAGRPVWLALNATRSLVTGVLLQVLDGSIRVFADWVREGEPGAVIRDIISEANVESGGRVRLTAGPLHFDQYNNVGLRQAVAKVPLELRAGVQPERARDHIRALLRAERQGMPALMVSSNARWTLNGLAGGYSRALLKQGQLAEYAEEGVYRTLLEGFESFVGLLELGGSTDGEDGDRFNAVTHDGRRYTSMLGNKR